MGYFERLRSIALETIAEIGGSEQRARLEELGFEQLHRIVEPWSVPHLVSVLVARYAPLSRPFVWDLWNHFASSPAMPYAAIQSWVRIMMPEDVVACYRELFAGQPGHTIAHNPHRDSWFSQALNMVNLWMALGPVRHGNSILLYPDVFGRPLRRSEKTIAWDQAVGLPVSYDLAPGDILMFSGEQLHSSELNVSGLTRFVLSFRFTIGEPVYGDGQGRTPYLPLTGRAIPT